MYPRGRGLSDVAEEEADILPVGRRGGAEWSGTTKNQDVSTGPLARPFARGKVYNLMSQFYLVLTHSAMLVVVRRVAWNRYGPTINSSTSLPLPVAPLALT